MSDDSISRHEVLRIIRTMPPEEGSTKALLEMSVKQLPSTEPIRCKDCKHSEFWYRDKRRCFLWHEEGISVFNDGFCNYAERRTDADMRGEPMSDFGKDINVPNKDIVYRQDVEDMLQNALPSRGMWEIEGDVVKNAICETVADLMMDLGKLPPAQPEKRTEERTETHACDLQPTCNQLATDTISRQSAIEVIDAVFPVDPMKSEYAQGIACGAALAKTYVEQLPSAQPSGKDPIEREAVVDILHDAMQGCSESEENLIGEIVCKVDLLPSAQRTCLNCGRTVNNGGWYADGKTRCPIEEHYALPKDGYCHLWEKRNVTDDDYPERREE